MKLQTSIADPPPGHVMADGSQIVDVLHGGDVLLGALCTPKGGTKCATDVLENVTAVRREPVADVQDQFDGESEDAIAGTWDGATRGVAAILFRACAAVASGPFCCFRARLCS